MNINIYIPIPAKRPHPGKVYIIHMGIILFDLLPLYFSSMAAVRFRVYRRYKGMMQNNIATLIKISPPCSYVKFFREKKKSVKIQFAAMLKKNRAIMKVAANTQQALKRGGSLCFL